MVYHAGTRDTGATTETQNVYYRLAMYLSFNIVASSLFCALFVRAASSAAICDSDFDYGHSHDICCDADDGKAISPMATLSEITGS